MTTNDHELANNNAEADGLGARVGSFFDEWWPETLLGTPSIAGIFASLFPENTLSLGTVNIRLGIAALILALVFAILGGIGVARKNKKMTKLKEAAKENRNTAKKYQKDTRELIQDNLRDLARECKLNSGDRACRTDSRISVYCHDGSSGRFIPIARISGDPEFEKKGRPHYPDTEGVICRAWREEFYKYQYQSSSESDENWLKEQEELFSVPPDVADAFVMKSLSSVALRIEHRDKKIGVLVIESTDKDRADATLMNSVLTSTHFPPLQRALYRVNESHVRNMAKIATRE